MLLKSDIEFIKKTRKEITQNRTSDVVLYRKTKTGEDAFTGDAKYEIVEETVQAVWLHYTSESTGTDDRKIVNGVVAEVGDAFAEFELDVDLKGVDKVKFVPTGELWAIRGVDLIGIGEPNRQYVLLGKVH